MLPVTIIYLFGTRYVSNYRKWCNAENEDKRYA